MNAISLIPLQMSQGNISDRLRYKNWKNRFNVQLEI